MDSIHPNAEYNQDAARLAVADILSTMANTVEAMTPTTLAILDGLTGVPTRTTPTLTPTTLRNIEQTFMDLAAVASNQVPHQHEAGFVPPLVPLTIVPHSTAPSYSLPATTQQDSSKLWQSTMANSSSNDSATSQGLLGMFRSATRRLSEGSDSNSSNSGNSSGNYGPVRKGGGRRKEDRLKDLQLPVEEVEKRQVRRERNKMAAARCRKRRLDHTMALEEETSALEDKKQSLYNEIRQLTKEKEELEFLLDAHGSQCKLRKLHEAVKTPNPINIKQEPASPRNEFTKPAPRPRPTSLPVTSPFTPQVHKSMERPTEIAGIPITTPSNGISGLNLESLMEGGTGLTPVVPTPSPSCATQQRSSALPVDLSSPESATRKLVSL